MCSCAARRHDSSFTEKRKAECCTETSVSVYQATRCHSPEGSWLHGQHFTSDSFLLLQDTSQGHSVITRELNVKCLSLVIWHCGKVRLRSLPLQKFPRPLRWDSDKELIRFYLGNYLLSESHTDSLYTRKCDDSLPYACVHKLTMLDSIMSRCLLWNVTQNGQ
jgi:hypothetical protein